MTAYYNEHDPYAAAWLRNLITAGHIAPGDVDERSIEDVRPTELAGYTQCHFFAGIGGWSYALRQAGWPDDRPVWTGSCPCQPFSAAGQGKGAADERHLWPSWFHLIAQCQPGVVFGEQVEAAINHGWLDLVQSDLEGEGYACGFVGLPAAGVGAPHIRQRLWFVADAKRKGLEGLARHGNDSSESRRLEKKSDRSVSETGSIRGLSDAIDGIGTSSGTQRYERDIQVGHWSDVEWIEASDGRKFPIKPGLRLLAHGVSARVGRLRAYGNAIVPQVAAEVIRAYLHG